MANTRRAADIMKQFQNMDTDDKNEDIEYIFGVDSEDNKQLEGLRSIQKSIAPELLHPHPNNQFNISYDSEYESLKKAISEYGITNPIICYESGNEYIILSGHRRAKVAKELGLNKVPVRIIENPQKLGWSKFDELVFLGSENLSSRKQNPIDVARFASDLIDELEKEETETGIKIPGRKRDYIAERIPGLKGRTISTYLKLLDLPLKFQNWTDKLYNLTTALKLAEISHSKLFDDEMFVLSNEIERILTDLNISQEEKIKRIDKKIVDLCKEYERLNEKPKTRKAEKKLNVKTEIKKIHTNIQKFNKGDCIVPEKIIEQKTVLKQIKEIRKKLDDIEKEIYMTTPK